MICAFLAYPFKTFKDLAGSLFELFRNEEKEDQETISQLERLAHIRRIYGIREMEEEAKRVRHSFIRKGISLLADDYDRFEIYNILEKDVELFYAKRSSQINILETLGKMAPAFGFVGTIIGLISVLSNMENPAEIGKGMSIALLTTLYGSLISNFIFLPLARKLSEYTKTQAMELNMVMEGIMDICDKKNPKAIAHRLRSYSGEYPSERKRDFPRLLRWDSTLQIFHDQMDAEKGHHMHKMEEELKQRLRFSSKKERISNPFWHNMSREKVRSYGASSI